MLNVCFYAHVVQGRGSRLPVWNSAISDPGILGTSEEPDPGMSTPRCPGD